MDHLTYVYNTTIADPLSDKLNQSMLFPKVENMMQEDWYLADSFYADGHPVEKTPGVIYPAFAPYYLQQKIPSSYLELSRSYCRTAAISTVRWLEKMLPAAKANISHFDGEIFDAHVNGSERTFCFPRLTISYFSNPNATAYNLIKKTAAVLPFPDTRENDDDWEGATVPSYVESQARLLLWCWHQAEDLGRHTEVPDTCFIVRITGNTPSDVSVRTIRSDTAKENALVTRMCRNMERAEKQGIELSATPNIREQLKWYEAKEQNVENAYHVENEDFYNLVKQHMMLVSHRKTCEADSKRIAQQMEAIAVELASFTSVDSQRGTVIGKDIYGQDKVYTVTHKRRNTQQASISASLIRQFFPEHLDCIVTNETRRGRVKIDAVE